MSGFASGIANMENGEINSEAAVNAAGAQVGQGTAAMNTANQVYGQSSGNFQPAIQVGRSADQQLGQDAGPNGSLGRQFTMADFNKDPAYQFDVQQGLQAISNSNSVRGGALSGGTMKAMSNYGTQQASNEFGNAASRFTQNQNQNFSQLATLAGQGVQAGQDTAMLGQNYSNANTALRTNIGNAQAGGILGQAAGQNQVNSGAAGAVTSLGTMAFGS